MLFHAAEDDRERSGLHHRKVSEGGLVQIGVYDMFYGHRVRAGFCDDQWGVTLDWCCGSNLAALWGLYGLLEIILEKRPEDRNCFDGLPQISEVKPWYNDAEFMRAIGAIPEVVDSTW